jgi:septum formation protein
MQVCWQERTRVFFAALTDEEMGRYLATRTWQGCSGAYAIREEGDPYVRVVEGSVSNVVGLPLETLGRVLAWLAPGVGRH